MARLTPKKDFQPIIDAAQHWIGSCLIEDGSMLSSEPLWTETNVAEVRAAFTENPHEGEEGFSTKLREQMKSASKFAQRLMAEMLWALLLFPSNIKVSTKRQQVSELWLLSGQSLPEDHPMLTARVVSGIGSGGTGFNTHRWRELVFLIALVGDLKKRPPTERKKLLSDYSGFFDWISGVPQAGERQFRHMLRFFAFPDHVERMASNGERRLVLEGFGAAPQNVSETWSDRRLDEELLKLRSRLEKEFPGQVLDFYEPPLLERWKESQPIARGETPTRERRYWVEKTIVVDRPDRKDGNHALGKALWSPQRADGNRDIYRPMREIQEGDVVFHFVDNKELQSVSIAAGEADETFTGIEGTDWSGRPAYRVPLREHRSLTPPIHRSEFLSDYNYRNRISKILERHRGLFFNREFNLNQGSYLTEAPIELVQLWDEIYRRKSGNPLLPGTDLGSAPPDVVPIEPTGLAAFDTRIVDALEEALQGAGVVVSRTLVIRMLASLVSKNFVILTGLAGSGKTKLAQALARWLPSSSMCFRVVAVGADWTGNENVLGYPNGLEKTAYISKPSLDVILHANGNPAIPYFLILDEMNLSHVERYFADILSAIESDEKIHLHRDTVRKADGIVIPAEVALPKNLFIVGTVNVDETTYMFSPKVLDRANVIEFRVDASELDDFLAEPTKPDLSKLDGKGSRFGKAFVDAATNPATVPDDVKTAFDAEMLLLFKTLQVHGAEFGYRTVYEATRFIHFYKLLGDHSDGDTNWFTGAFDCVVFQKLLPKLHGSRTKLGPVLKKLWFLCVNDAEGRGGDALKAADEAARSTDKKAEPSAIIPAGAPYPLSAAKITRMWRLLMDNGFASFAEA